MPSDGLFIGLGCMIYLNIRCLDVTSNPSGSLLPLGLKEDETGIGITKEQLMKPNYKHIVQQEEGYGYASLKIWVLYSRCNSSSRLRMCLDRFTTVTTSADIRGY